MGIASGHFGVGHLVAGGSGLCSLSMQILDHERSILHVSILVLLNELRLLQVLHGGSLSNTGYLGQGLSLGEGIIEAVWVALFENLRLR